MNVPGVLNLLWALGALLALGLLAAAEWRRRASLRDGCRRAIALLIAAVAVFPAISPSDDMVSVTDDLVSVTEAQSVNAGPTLRAVAPASSDGGSALYLARLEEALECSRIATAVWLLMTLCFFAFVRPTTESGAESSVPSPTGRAPPLVPSFA